jgi:hypothetical protein
MAAEDPSACGSALGLAGATLAVPFVAAAENFLEQSFHPAVAVVVVDAELQAA